MLTLGVFGLTSGFRVVVVVFDFKFHVLCNTIRRVLACCVEETHFIPLDLAAALTFYFMRFDDVTSSPRVIYR